MQPATSEWLLMVINAAAQVEADRLSRARERLESGKVVYPESAQDMGKARADYATACEARDWVYARLESVGIFPATYLASRYTRRKELLGYRDELQAMGFVVVGRWLDGDHQITDEGLSAEADHEKRRQFAQDDWDDVMRAELVISFTEAPRALNSRGGRHVEFGAALAAGKTCLVIGPRENVFHSLPDKVVWYPEWSAALGWLAEYIDRRS